MPGERFIIIGAGGFGREVLAWARGSAEPCDPAGFLDDRPSALDRFLGRAPVLGSVSGYAVQPEDRFVCAIGKVADKRACVEGLLSRGAQFGRMVHRSAVIGEGVEVGRGVILCPFVVIGSDAQLGDFVTVNYHSAIAHDAVVGRWSQIHCHADITGGVVIGEGVTIGSHASILPGVKVGDGATIGAGAVVMRDVPSGATVYGSPARSLAARPAGGEESDQ